MPEDYRKRRQTLQDKVVKNVEVTKRVLIAYRRMVVPLVQTLHFLLDRTAVSSRAEDAKLSSSIGPQYSLAIAATSRHNKSLPLLSDPISPNMSPIAITPTKEGIVVENKEEPNSKGNYGHSRRYIHNQPHWVMLNDIDCGQAFGSKRMAEISVNGKYARQIHTDHDWWQDLRSRTYFFAFRLFPSPLQCDVCAGLEMVFFLC